MEILNNLGSLISVPNELFIRILSIPLLIFIEAPLSFSLISNIFRLELNTKKMLIYIFTTGIIAVIATFFISSPIFYYKIRIYKISYSYYIS